MLGFFLIHLITWFQDLINAILGFGSVDSEFEIEREGRASPVGGFSSNTSTYKSLLDSASKAFAGND
jgi:hypothetical protein